MDIDAPPAQIGPPMPRESTAIPIGPAPGQTQRVLLVTGLLGAGKTTALKALEDLGWEHIDNFPIRLLGRLIDTPQSGDVRAPLAIGFDSRTRGFDPHQIIERVKKLSGRDDLELTTLFLVHDGVPDVTGGGRLGVQHGHTNERSKRKQNEGTTVEFAGHLCLASMVRIHCRKRL